MSVHAIDSQANYLRLKLFGWASLKEGLTLDPVMLQEWWDHNVGWMRREDIYSMMKEDASPFLT